MVITGNTLRLTSSEFARAIDAFLVANGVNVSGARTVYACTDEVLHVAREVRVVVIVDPSGRVELAP